jgi:selenide,water dikinase
MDTIAAPTIRLTELSHGGGCGAALKKQQLGDEQYAAMIAQATQLNTPGMALGGLDDVHALTDVTGFGLLGHLLEICRGSGVGARLLFDRVPLLPGVLALARAGMITGGSARDWAGYGADVTWRARGAAATQALLTDPQTSGQLLAACAPAAVEQVLAVFNSEGFERAAVVGEITAGAPHIVVD